MSKHTPGPWHWVNPDDDSAWEGDGPASLRTIKEYGKNETKIIDGNRYTSFALPKFVLGYVEDIDNKADASLIAAAPDLLKACKQARIWLESWDSAEPCLSVINAAIAKATGE